MTQAPHFTLTAKIFDLTSEIMRLLGKYEGLTGSKPQPQLRRLNRIKTIQGSLAIEGNSLTLDQVTAVLDGKRVMGLQKDIQEALNANSAYEQIPLFSAHSADSLLKAHKVMMKGLLPDAGKWRAGSVGILKGSRVSHIAPKPQYVQGMVKDLLAFVKKSKTNALISSSVFHHEFEFIHPFTDGNGRLGRLWQHLLLTRFHPVFEFVPIESMIRDRQERYYESLEAADKAGDSTVFVEFMLEAIFSSTQEFLSTLKVEKVTSDDRLQSVREHFQKKWFSRKDYQGVFANLSAPTASRDLKKGLDLKWLERQGDQALARYRFR